MGWDDIDELLEKAHTMLAEGFEPNVQQVVDYICACPHGLDQYMESSKVQKECVCNRKGCWFTRQAVQDAVKEMAGLPTVNLARALIMARLMQLEQQDPFGYAAQVRADAEEGVHTPLCGLPIAHSAPNTVPPTQKQPPHLPSQDAARANNPSPPGAGIRKKMVKNSKSGALLLGHWTMSDAFQHFLHAAASVGSTKKRKSKNDPVVEVVERGPDGKKYHTPGRPPAGGIKKTINKAAYRGIQV